MIALDRRSWLLAAVGSIILHAALTIGLRLPAPGDAQKSAGAPISVSGTLAGILGTQNTLESTDAVEAAVSATEVAPVDPFVPNPSAPLDATGASRVPPVEVETRPREADLARPLTPQPTGPVDARNEIEAVTPLTARPATASPVLPAELVEASKPASAEPAPPTDLPTKAARETRAREPDRVPAKQEPAASTRDTVKKKRSRPRPRPSARPRSRAGSNKQGAAGSQRGGQRGRATASAGAVRRYALRVRSRILANRPSRSGSGRVVISFGLSPTGRLRYVRIARRSGNAALDRAALAAVRRSAPFPRPPRGARPGQLRFSIPFRFR